jgi:transposase
MIAGISTRARTSERFRKWVFDVALRSSSLALARTTCRVSVWFVFHYFHQMLQLKLREYRNPWPARIGIDEHSFRRNKQTGEVEFVTIFVDHCNKRIRAIVLGRDKLSLVEAIRDIQGATKVQAVSIDLSLAYREFVREAFPNAAIVADKFHVMRLFGNLIKRERIDALGDKRTTELVKLLKRSQKNLSTKASGQLRDLMAPHQKLREAYEFKVAMYWVYRKATKAMARVHFIEILDKMAISKNPKVATLRSTLIEWQRPILAYFDFKITNARVEGFNNKCKGIKRRGYGYRKVENYARRCIGEVLLKKRG